MAVGDLITGDWQMERNGLLIGDGTNYDLRVIDGLAGQPGVRSQDRTRNLRHGAVPGEDYLEPRTFVVEIDIIEDASNSLSALIDTLIEAFAPSVDEVNTAFQIPGVCNGAKARSWTRVRNRDIPIDLEYYYGVAKASFEMTSTDPRLYANANSSDTANLAPTTGGLTFNATANFTFGTVSQGGTVTVTNAGTFATPAVFTITGPCTDPSIENVTAGATLDFTGYSLTASETLVIDTDARTILLGGTSSRYFWLSTDSEWFDLLPGDNEINFLAQTYTAATLDVAWRSAWV